jgi:hypothetical protein
LPSIEHKQGGIVSTHNSGDNLLKDKLIFCSVIIIPELDYKGKLELFGIIRAPYKGFYFLKKVLKVSQLIILASGCVWRRLSLFTRFADKEKIR